MKRKIQILALLLAGIAGCHAQIQSNPTVNTCSAASSGTWTALPTPATEITGTTLTDQPATGSWCYAVESVNNTYSPAVASVPSNVILATTTASLTHVDLTWAPPLTSPVPITGYVVYRIAAIQATITAPVQGTATIAEIQKPADPKKPTPPSLLVALLPVERNTAR